MKAAGKSAQGSPIATSKRSPCSDVNPVIRQARKAEMRKIAAPVKSGAVILAKTSGERAREGGEGWCCCVGELAPSCLASIRTVVGNGGEAEEEEAISGTSKKAHAQKNNAVLAFESDDIDGDVRSDRACRNAQRATKELRFFRIERTTIFLTILD